MHESRLKGHKLVAIVAQNNIDLVSICYVISCQELRKLKLTNFVFVEASWPTDAEGEPVRASKVVFIFFLFVWSLLHTFIEEVYEIQS